MQVRLNLRDCFSGCTDSKEIEVNQEQLAKLEQLQTNEVVCSQFDKKDQIHYNWIIEEVEII